MCAFCTANRQMRMIRVSEPAAATAACAAVAATRRYQLLGSTPRGFSDLLAREIAALGGLDVRDRGNHGVSFTGSLELAYRLCLESRVASRLYVELLRFAAPDTESFYAAIRALDWTQHLDAGRTLACEFSGRHPTLTNTHFAALKLKDAVCDALRDATGARPDVATEEADLRLHAHANGSNVTLSIDLSGAGLHRRGWRHESGSAPLRENVAAGILIRAGWPQRAATDALQDPMCGSGTFVIEAALIAADVAPGLARSYFGFLGWKGHDAPLWQRLLEHARQRATAGVKRSRALALQSPRRLLGRDIDPRMLSVSIANAAQAGVGDLVRFETGDLASALPQAGSGLLVANPPYGERMEDRERARALHAELGRVLREHFNGWQAAILTGSPDLGLELGLRAARVHTVWNGPIECRLLRIDVQTDAARDLKPRLRTEVDETLRDSKGSQMFANRIAKNLKKLASWALREGVSCYRIYDADMPEYSFAIDLYTSHDQSQQWLYVQEYAAPNEIPEDAVRRRRSEAMAALPTATGVASQNIHLRTRRRNLRGEQYAKQAERGDFQLVAEAGLLFWVNFSDYLDTGLFLDHRITRARLRSAARDRHFLNLFAYTGSASVYCAAGGARSTTSIDLSNTYLDWAQRNLAQNGFSGRSHELVRADVREWLPDAASRGARFDLIFLDPPTFSNSKRMDGILDTQRDHAVLIEQCRNILAPDGVLVFSTNAQRLKLDPGLLQRFAVKDISRLTIPTDFARDERVHQAFEISHLS